MVLPDSKNVQLYARYARRFVIYEKTSQVTVQDDNPLYCMSASESNGYKWQTNINNDDDKTRVDVLHATFILAQNSSRKEYYLE
jgi:hypothetical protein